MFAASFRDLDDKLQPLKQWRGKVVVLNFWAPWCPPCREEMPDFIKLQDKYHERGLVFISFENQWVKLLRHVELRDFAERYDLVIAPSGRESRSGDRRPRATSG